MATPSFAPASDPSRGNGIATAGLVCGILGLILCWVPLAGIVLALLGIIFGGIGISKSGRLGGKGRGMAIGGLVCGILSMILGLLAAIAIPAFLGYMNKAKKTESSLQLRSIEIKIKTFYMEKGRLPKSATEMPGSIAVACGSPDQRLPRKSQSQWEAAGWGEMGFHVDEDSRYSYRWTQESPTLGFAEAIIDADCDGMPSITRLDIAVDSGNVRATHHEPTGD